MTKSSLAIFTFSCSGNRFYERKIKNSRSHFEALYLSGVQIFFKSHDKHIVLFCSWREINGTAPHQANNYKWIAWYAIKKSSLLLFLTHRFRSKKRRRHREAEHKCLLWSHGSQIAVSRKGGNFPEIRNISGKWKKNSGTWAAPWRHTGSITSKMSAFRRTPRSHQAI